MGKDVSSVYLTKGGEGRSLLLHSHLRLKERGERARRRRAHF